MAKIMWQMQTLNTLVIFLVNSLMLSIAFQITLFDCKVMLAFLCNMIVILFFSCKGTRNTWWPNAGQDFIYLFQWYKWPNYFIGNALGVQHSQNKICNFLVFTDVLHSSWRKEILYRMDVRQYTKKGKKKQQQNRSWKGSILWKWKWLHWGPILAPPIFFSVIHWGTLITNQEYLVRSWP